MFKISKIIEHEDSIDVCYEAKVPYELVHYLGSVAEERKRSYVVQLDEDKKEGVVFDCLTIVKREGANEWADIERIKEILSYQLATDLKEAERLRRKFRKANADINELFIPFEDLDPVYEVLGRALDYSERLKNTDEIDRLIMEFSSILNYVYRDITNYFGPGKTYAVKVLKPLTKKVVRSGCLTAIIDDPYLYLIDEQNCIGIQILRLKPVGENSELWVLMDGIDMYPCEAGCKCGSDSVDCEELYE